MFNAVAGEVQHAQITQLLQAFHHVDLHTAHQCRQKQDPRAGNSRVTERRNHDVLKQHQQHGSRHMQHIKEPALQPTAGTGYLAYPNSSKNSH